MLQHFLNKINFFFSMYDFSFISRIVLLHFEKKKKQLSKVQKKSGKIKPNEIFVFLNVTKDVGKFDRFDLISF